MYLLIFLLIVLIAGVSIYAIGKEHKPLIIPSCKICKESWGECNFIRGYSDCVNFLMKLNKKKNKKSKSKRLK